MLGYVLRWEHTNRAIQAISEEQLKAFIEAVKADEGLQENLKSAADVDAVVEIAKDAGFKISAKELEMSKEPTEDEELERVAGGRSAADRAKNAGRTYGIVALSITTFGMGCAFVQPLGAGYCSRG